MATHHTDNRLYAILCILAAVGLASTQDAIVKSMSGSYSAYETIILRCTGSAPILAAMLFAGGHARSMVTPYLWRVLLRSAILCSAYLAFVLSIATMPIANSVAIYFTMPFFVAGLAGPLLGERVRLHRWLAIGAAFLAVLIMVRPGVGVFEPAAFLALYSAFGYALGQMMGRPLAQNVSPIVIANWQNFVYFGVALVLCALFNATDIGPFEHKSLQFLSRPWVWPSFSDFAILCGNGIIAAFAMVLFVTAYKFAESNFVAPFEYSAMIWAVFYGLVIFGDFPDAFTWAGALLVVAAGLYMLWRDRQLDRSLA